MLPSLKLPESCRGIDIALWKTLGPSKEMHRHDFYELVFVFTGRGVHITEEGSYGIGPGDLFVVPPGVAHGYSDRENVSLINIMFDMRRFPQTLDLIRQEAGFRAFFETGPALCEEFRFCNKLTLAHEDREKCEQIAHELDYEFRLKQTGWALNLFALLARLFVLIARIHESKRYNSQHDLLVLDRIIQDMRASLKTPLRIPELAGRHGLSLKALERLFACSMQCTPLSYLNSLRLHEAARVLGESSRKISAVAAAAGFLDSNYFAKQFRAKFGLSPRDYRKRQMEQDQ
jgi:AraC-like DNA-binding protein/mannose-6-phosphate isomerase-like protein (cupin superfamily)